MASHPDVLWPRKPGTNNIEPIFDSIQETFETLIFFFEFKENENVNQMNTLSIPRVKI